MKGIGMYGRLISIFWDLENWFCRFSCRILWRVIIECLVSRVCFWKDGIVCCKKCLLFLKVWKRVGWEIILGCDRGNDVWKCEVCWNVVCCMCCVGRVIIFDWDSSVCVSVVLWCSIVVFVEDGSRLGEEEEESKKKNRNIEKGLLMWVLLLKRLNDIINVKLIYWWDEWRDMKYIWICYKKDVCCWLDCVLN